MQALEKSSKSKLRRSLGGDSTTKHLEESEDKVYNFLILLTNKPSQKQTN